jgi:hypothetical protein
MKPIVLAAILTVGPVCEIFGQSIDFRNDPRAEAELLAVEITDALRPEVTLADRIQGDLSAIRSAYPSVADIRMFAAWVPGAVEVQLTPPAYDAYLDGTYSGFDALYGDLGTPTADLTYFNSSMRSLMLSFANLYHGERLADLFRTADGVSSAFAIGFAGDGDDIVARADRTYTLSHGYGDCPAGCIFRDAWTFAVTDADITLIDQPDGSRLPFKVVPPQATLPEPATIVQCLSLFAAGIGLMVRRRPSRGSVNR